MIHALFAAIDARDPAAFSRFIDPDCVFRFGNQPAVSGRAAITEYVTGFFASIQALRHELVELIETPQASICHGFVTYTRHDGSTLRVPFCNVFKPGRAGIGEYLIFADNSTLYTP